ncbi:hypothetical protein V7139_29240, partial [Neobacillus drentensis]|uniref:hypothetical protein n=1 Tax=Neobacillus drentensis TaxID=220684 RepID=UPI0030020B84
RTRYFNKPLLNKGASGNKSIKTADRKTIPDTPIYTLDIALFCLRSTIPSSRKSIPKSIAIIGFPTKTLVKKRKINNK